MKTLREDTTPDPEALIAARITEPVAEQPKPAPTGERGERYAGMKKMLIPIEVTMHRRLKALAAEQGKTLEKAVQDACAAYIARPVGD